MSKKGKVDLEKLALSKKAKEKALSSDQKIDKNEKN